MQMMDERLDDVYEKLSQLDNVMHINFKAIREKQDAYPYPRAPAPLIESKPVFPPKAEKTDLVPSAKITPREKSHGTPGSQKQQSNPEDAKEEPVDAASDDELSIPIEHTTAAHKLLLWPSIQKLLPEKVDNDYVMMLEGMRGPIRLYGRGEGEVDQMWVTTQQPTSPMMNSPSPHKDEAYLTSSPGA